MGDPVLDTDSILTVRPAESAEIEMVDGETIAQGNLGAIRDQYASADQGLAEKFQPGGTEPQQLLGFARTPAPTRGTGIGLAGEDLGLSFWLKAHLYRLSVTGAASAADNGKPVYFSDAATPTLTPPSKRAVVGKVLKWIEGTECWVLLYPMALLDAIGYAGGNKRIWSLGVFDASQITGAGDVRTNITAPHKGKILSVHARIISDITSGGGGTADLNLEIGGTNVTGGVVQIVDGDVAGDKKAGTAVTDDGNQVFQEGDEIDVEAATVTALTGGMFELFATIENLPGI